MLFWAIFTLGFMFGVFLTLYVIKGGDGERTEYTKIQTQRDSHVSVWDLHKKLISPNYGVEKTRLYSASKDASKSTPRTAFESN